MQDMRSIIKNRFKNTYVNVQAEKAMAIKEIELIITELFSAQALRHIKTMYIKDNVIYINCLSSVLVQEISLNKLSIIEKLNNKFDKQPVEDIRFIT